MNAVVHVVDDDASVLAALGRILRADGLEVSLSSSPDEFLHRWDPEEGGCVVLDLHMPGMDGLQLQHLLAERGPVPPLIFVSGTSDTAERLACRSVDARALVVVTHGARGCTALESGRRVFEPAVPVPATEQVDTTGCGDAFQAAFTVAWAGGASIKEALRAGARRAAEVVRYLGAIPVAGVP